MSPTCRFLKVIIVSSFKEEANAQKKKIGIHNDLAVLLAELCQNLAGAPSNALLVDLFLRAAPRKKKTNVWARLRGQQEQLTIQVVLHPFVEENQLCVSATQTEASVKQWQVAGMSCCAMQGVMNTIQTAACTCSSASALQGTG